jgi:hypothetical protein
VDRKKDVIDLRQNHRQIASYHRAPGKEEIRVGVPTKVANKILPSLQDSKWEGL